MRFSNRAAFGWIETPAPISLTTSACSNTVASRPRARSASAAVRPPIPPPIIAMRSEPGISFRPLLLTTVADDVMLPSGCGLSAGHQADAPRGIGQAGNDMPAHDSMPAYIAERTQTLHADGGCFLPGLGRCIRLFERRIELKTVAFQIVFSTTLLYYTFVKLSKRKMRPESGAGATQAQAVARRRPPLPFVQLRGIRRSGQDSDLAASLAADYF